MHKMQERVLRNRNVEGFAEARIDETNLQYSLTVK